MRKGDPTILRTLLGLILLALVACRTTTDTTQLAELEAENAGPREQLEERIGTMADDASSEMESTPGSDTDGVEILSVTDGDTMRVLVEGENEPLRLIGINAPESGECLAAQATRRLAELVGRGPIFLESDVSDRDDFGRLLRYVYAADLFVNETLVREGLAVARRYEPDTTRFEQLEAAQRRAASEGVGMWDDQACGPAGDEAVEIGQIHFDAAGDDNHNLNDEWVEIVNGGGSSVDLTGWSVKDESATHRYHFPDGFHLDTGTAVRLHTGCGRDTSASLYWCNQGSAVWNNTGDTVFVLDPHGNVVVSRRYGP